MSHYIHGRVLKGDERRALVRYLAFHRAEFENKFEGQPIQPLDRDFIVSSLPNEYRRERQPYEVRGQITINISDALIEAVRKQVPARRRQLKEFS